MDLIHKLSIVALVILSLATTGMLVQHQRELASQPAAAHDPKKDLQKYYQEEIAKNATIYAEVTTLMQQKQFEKGLQKLQEIRKAHPDNAQSDIYEAQLQYGLGNVVAALHSYRAAVDKEPDYVDKTTPFFVGDKITDLVSESRSKLHREKKLKPNDKKILKAIDDAYYLERRAAGGCE